MRDCGGAARRGQNHGAAAPGARAARHGRTRPLRENRHRSRARGIRRHAAGQFCPDHFFLDAWPDLFADARARGCEFLFVETAGLCGRCAPYFTGAAALAVVSFCNSSRAPRKIGPVLGCADIIVFTGADLVSPAERRAFTHLVRAQNSRARLIAANGLTGEGTAALAAALDAAPPHSGPGAPRHAAPAFICSYCFGKDEAGSFRL